eukprot:scaffold55661_cov46-Attheya_sp.AAC.2
MGTTQYNGTQYKVSKMQAKESGPTFDPNIRFGPSWIRKFLCMPLRGDAPSFKALNIVEDGRKFNNW